MGYFGGDRPLIAMAPTLLHRNQPRFDRLAKWPLAVCDATPAAPASSRAVSARPSISTSSMLARIADQRTDLRQPGLIERGRHPSSDAIL